MLATDCGGIRECITEQNGLIVPVDDKDEIARGLRYFVDNYSNYDRDFIRDDCKKRFSPETIAAQLTAIFENTYK